MSLVSSRQVMKHNYDEMRDMKQQNQQMRDDVREIMEILRGNQAGQLTARDQTETIPPMTRSRTVNEDRLFTQRPQPENGFVGPGKMVGKNMGAKSNRNVSNVQNQGLEPVRGASPVKAQPKPATTHLLAAQRSQPNMASRLDTQPKSAVRALTPAGAATASNPNTSSNRNLLPPIICSVQEGGILPAGKSKSTVKRAPTFKK